MDDFIIHASSTILLSLFALAAIYFRYANFTIECLFDGDKQRTYSASASPFVVQIEHKAFTMKVWRG